MYEAYYLDRDANMYEAKKIESIQSLYAFSETVSKHIVLYSSSVNNRMVSHWFVNSVAKFISKQNNVTDENIWEHIEEFDQKFTRNFAINDVISKKEPLEELNNRATAYVLLDWATRHIKHIQININENFTPREYGELCHFWGILYSNCSVLNIPILKYCKETYVPYKARDEYYRDIFKLHPNDPHESPTDKLLPSGHFYPIIERLENTDNKY